MQQKNEQISNGMYVIKRLKAFYPAFRNHLDKLEKEEKRYLLEEYENAFKHLTFFDVQAKTSAAIQASTNRAPSVKDILDVTVKSFVQKSGRTYTPSPREKDYAAALERGDWEAMKNIRTGLANHYRVHLNLI